MTIRIATVTMWAAVAAAVAVSAQAPPAQTPAPAGQMRTFTPEEMTAFRAVLPEGPARDLTIRVCAQCHEPNRASA